MPFAEMMEFWTRMNNGGRKSFLISELDPQYYLDVKKNGFLPILEGLQKDLANREDN